MKKQLLHSSLAALAVLVSISTAIAQSAGGPVPVITEIMYNPPEAGIDSLEFIEIHNPSLSASINMGGYYIEDAFAFTFPAGFILGMGEYVIVSGDSVVFENTFGLEALEWSGAANQLSNNGESIVLRFPGGSIADSVNYDNSNPWPTGADGGGYSLVLCDPTADNSLAENWTLSENNTGIVVNGKTIYADPGAPSTCTTVGIADDNVITTVVYPNPTEGEFVVRFASIEKAGLLNIYNSLGQIVYTETLAVGTTSTTIDSNIKSGFYVVSLHIGDSTEQHRLIVE